MKTLTVWLGITSPKKIPFDKINASDLQKIETKLNNRPRKCLGYKTPLEIFSK